MLLFFRPTTAPGGSVVDDDAPQNPLSVFETDGSDGAVKRVCEFIRDLIRRYKYVRQAALSPPPSPCELLPSSPLFFCPHYVP